MGLIDLFKGKFVDPTYPGVHAGGDIITTSLDAMVKWGRKSSIWPMPFGTACCAIEFMAVSFSHYDIARFGAEVLRFSPRQSDLMFVAGTIVDKQAPVLKTIYDQMPEPKWVISMGVCASSGGFYRSYHTMQGIDEIIPVDVYVPGCPPSPEGLLAALMKIQEKIQKGQQAQGAAGRRTASARPAPGPSTAAPAGRSGRQDDAARRATGQPPRGAPRAARPPGRHQGRAPWLASPPPPPPRSSPGPPPASSPRRSASASSRLDDFRGDLAITVDRRGWVEAARLLRDHPELDYKLFLDLCGVDYLDREDTDATGTRWCCTSTPSRRSTTSG